MILLHTLRARNFKQLRDVTLDFPDNGSVLIEGHNEAGKSTLFEAAFFALYGKPLDSAANQEELKTYHADEMSVELVFSVDGRQFTVRRVVKANQACALEWTENGETKSLRGATAVNQRIREEVGLTASTLLNTCFVEQKNLERLESLDRNQRRDAINELLNLRVLSQLEAEFKVTADDKREVSRLRERVDVAKLDSVYPGLCAAEKEAEACERFARMLEITRQRTDWEAEAVDLANEREALTDEREEVGTKLADARNLASRLDRLRTVLTIRLQQWGRELANTEASAAKLNRLMVQADGLEEAQQQLRRVEAAAARLRKRDEDMREEQRIAAAHEGAVQALESEQQRSQEWRKRLEGLRASLPALEESNRVAEELVREAERVAIEAGLRDALSAWAEAMDRSGESPVGADGSDLDARETASRRRQDEAIQRGAGAAKRARAGWVLAGVGVAPAITGFAVSALLVPLLLVGLILVAAGVAIAFRATGAARSFLEETRAAQRDVDGIEGERRALAAQAARSEQDRDIWRERARAHGRRIEELGAAVPASAFAAREQCSALTPIAVAASITAAENARTRRSEELSKLEATRSRLETELESPVEISPDTEARVEALHSELENLRATLCDDGDIAAVLAPLGIPHDIAALDAELKRLRESVAACSSAANDLSSVRQEVERHGAAADNVRAEADEEWGDIMAGALMPEAPDVALDVVRRETAAAAEQLEQSDVDALEQQAIDLDQRIRDIEVNHRTVKLRIDEANRDLAAGAAAFGWTSSVDTEALALIRDSHPEVAPAGTKSPAEWEEAHRQANIQARSNRETRAARAAAVGLDETHLDLAEEQFALTASTREMNIKLRAGEIVRTTRASIVGRVMPLTLQNMRRLLPLLTDGRYHDAEWHEEANSLTVFDNEARRQVSKRVFSGGARDQISLSLRLAFALATLPGEYSTRPGWLFLDEPLSSFDRERTRQLVDLLTRGLVRDQFAQILLVSHSESFDPAQFDHRLRMEGGRIITAHTTTTEVEPAFA
jgi:DNA repair exonuclease SbcCD ATPase subunit